MYSFWSHANFQWLPEANNLKLGWKCLQLQNEPSDNLGLNDTNFQIVFWYCSTISFHNTEVYFWRFFKNAVYTFHLQIRYIYLSIYNYVLSSYIFKSKNRTAKNKNIIPLQLSNIMPHKYQVLFWWFDKWWKGWPHTIIPRPYSTHVSALRKILFELLSTAFGFL